MVHHGGGPEPNKFEGHSLSCKYNHTLNSNSCDHFNTISDRDAVAVPQFIVVSNEILFILIRNKSNFNEKLSSQLNGGLP